MKNRKKAVVNCNRDKNGRPQRRPGWETKRAGNGVGERPRSKPCMRGFIVDEVVYPGPFTVRGKQAWDNDGKEIPVAKLSPFSRAILGL
jgi:hypothetical protein